MPSKNNQQEKFPGGWMAVTILLIVIIIAGGAIIGAKYNRGQGIEISLETENETVGRIYISGDVNNPGLYPLQAGDRIESVLKAAGGLTGGADLVKLELAVSNKEDADTPQKVDINRAEAWLLAALPGIGETRAQTIISYRQKNGPYRDINELLKVPGMGNTIFERIKHLITISE